MRPELKIGYVLKMYPRFSETFIVTELLSLQEQGHAVEVFSLRAPNDGRFHESLAAVRFPVHYLNARTPRPTDLWAELATARAELPGFDDSLADLLRLDVLDAAQAVELALAVRRTGIDHLHAHFASVSTTVARLAARLARIGYSFTAHAKDIFHHDVDPEDLRRKVNDAAAVVTISDFNHQYLTGLFPSAADRIHRVYNGIDLAAFGFAAPTDRPPVIAAVGRLVEKKGFDDLLTAAGLLRDLGVDYRLELIGAGELAATLAAQRDLLGLQDRVTLHGALPQSQVRAVVGAASVLAVPCVVGADGNRDGLPTVVLEAMALGTPCVATPVTGMTEAVQHERTGLLVPEADPAALAGALQRLLLDPALRVQLAVAARALVEQEFDTRRQAAGVARHFGCRTSESALAGSAGVR